jgi:hypothetical protein
VSYMVIFRTADGKPGYQQADDVQDAAASVERLRNEDGVDNVRIYRMEEVAFEYKVHYSVQLTSPEAGSAPAAASVGPADAPAWDDSSEDDAVAPFDQMAVDPAGTPQWDDETEEPAAVDPVEAPEPVASDSDARRGLFGR